MKNLGLLMIAPSDDSHLMGGVITEDTRVQIAKIQRKPLVHD
jgi:hypothetical protein